MEILNRHLCIGKFFDRNPFILLTWESFPMNEVMDSISDTFGVDDIFHFGFFNTRYNFRGRRQCLFLRWEIALMIGMK